MKELIFIIKHSYNLEHIGIVYFLDVNDKKDIQVNDLLRDTAGNHFKVMASEVFRKVLDDGVTLLGIMLEQLDGIDVQGDILIKSAI